ncbi:MAG TPA: hypothetical protein VJT50_12040 [Pyrinomonadaceae bacterium]|nr:hypothetical protein [Pyrinomonadaceae bacterium]
MTRIQEVPDMKIITSALALLTVLSVSSLAQTSSTPEMVLQINRFSWGESVWPSWCDGCSEPQISKDYRWSHRAGAGDFSVWIVLKNLGSKPIKSISIDFIFRETATDREFLTYNFRIEKLIGRGKTKDIRHKIAKDKEPDNFQPLGPSYELLDRTRFCGNGPLALDRKTRQLVRIRDNEKLLKIIPCYYLPNVTRIEYTDGSAWQP